MRQPIHFRDATDYAVDYCLQDVFSNIIHILLSPSEEDLGGVSVCTQIFASHAFNGRFFIFITL